PILKQETHLPVVIDPSQGTGKASLVASMCKGAIAMGADALLIEVHPNPTEAWSDGAQQMTLDGFKKLMEDIRPIIAAAGREWAGRPGAARCGSPRPALETGAAAESQTRRPPPAPPVSLQRRGGHPAGLAKSASKTRRNPARLLRIANQGERRRA